MQKADTRRLSVALGSLSEVGVETEDQNTFRFYLGFFFNGLERIMLHFTERVHQYRNANERKWWSDTFK